MKLKKVFHWILILIMSCVLGFGFYEWNAKNLIGTKVPMPFGFGGAVVLSGSMEPTLSIDDLIIIHEEDQYEVNDIVVFQEDDVVVVHRIVNIEDEMVQTKGDANNVVDHPIELERVIGKVIFTIPGIGTLVNMIKSPIGMITILGISFALLELSYRKEKESGDKTIEEIKEEIRRLKEEL